MIKNAKKLKGNFQLLMNSIRDNLGCLLFWPEEYLYIFTYSKHEKVQIFPYNPKVREVTNMLKEKIQNAGISIPLHFIGSGVLGIAGQQDIDIFIECPAGEFGKYISTIRKLFGHETRIHRDFIEWCFLNEGYEVELVLIDPHSSKFQKQMDQFNIFLKNTEARLEYEKLKILANGQSMREYQKQKILFFYRTYKKYKF